MSQSGSNHPRTSYHNIALPSHLPSRSLRDKRGSVFNQDSESRRSSGSASNPSNGEESRKPKTKKRKIVEVPLTAIHPPPLAFPKSLYHGHEPPISQSYERAVLQEIVVGAP
jgi:hypothetical protein